MSDQTTLVVPQRAAAVLAEKRTTFRERGCVEFESLDQLICPTIWNHLHGRFLRKPTFDDASRRRSDGEAVFL